VEAAAKIGAALAPQDSSNNYWRLTRGRAGCGVQLHGILQAAGIDRPPATRFGSSGKSHRLADTTSATARLVAAPRQEEDTMIVTSIESLGPTTGARAARHLDIAFRDMMAGPWSVQDERYLRLVTGQPHPMGNVTVV
jgi:hypothetical protein